MIRYGMMLLAALACNISWATEQLQVIAEDVYPPVVELNEKVGDDLWLTVQANQNKLQLISLKNGGQVYRLEGKIFDGIAYPDLSTTKLKLIGAGDRKPTFGIEVDVGRVPGEQECAYRCLVLFSIKSDGQVTRRIKVMHGKDWTYSDIVEYNPAAPDPR